MHLQFSWGEGGIGRRRRRRETIKSQFLCRHGETGLISENKRIHVGRRRENKYSLGFFLPLSLPPLKSFTYFLLAVAKEIKACNISPPNRCTSGCVANYLCTAYVLMFDCRRRILLPKSSCQHDDGKWRDKNIKYRNWPRGEIPILRAEGERGERVEC